MSRSCRHARAATFVGAPCRRARRLLPALLVLVYPGPAAGQAETGAEPPPATAPGTAGETPTIEVVSGVPSLAAQALSDTLGPRTPGFVVVAAGAPGAPGAWRLEVVGADDGAGIRINLLTPEGQALVRTLAADPEMTEEQLLRFAAVLASHMVEEVAIAEWRRLPEPAPAPPPVPEPIVPPVPGPPIPAAPESPPAAPGAPVPAVRLGALAGIQASVGGIPAGDTMPAVVARAAWSFLPWLGAALEAGWAGNTSDLAGGLLSVIPLHAGFDFGVNTTTFDASLGLRLAVDVWTAKVDLRETGSRVGTGAVAAATYYPWEWLGFGLATGVDLFAVAVLLTADGEPAYALGRVRFLLCAGITGRI